MKLNELTIHQLNKMLAVKEISSEDITRDCLESITELDDKIKAFVTITKEEAIEAAKNVDKKMSEGKETGILAGIPMAVKDNMCTDGIKTTCSSKILYNFIPPYTATAVEKLYQEDGILLGKTNMDEFAMGSSTENSGFFATKNPWNLNCVPGGSSGGSAAAVSSGQAIFSLGSDTGGSIRQPAAYCGVVGLKPTYGAVSRFGLIAYASSLDQIGPFTKDITDCALVMNAISGHDKLDSTSADVEYPDYTSFLVNDIKGMRIGIPQEYYGEGIDPAVEAKLKEAAVKLEELGAIVEECSLPHTEYAMPAYYIVAPAECSSNLARYDGVRYGLRDEDADDLIKMFSRTRDKGFGQEVKRRIMLGTYALSSGYYDAYYLKALKVRNLIKQDFDQAFAKFDCLLTPTAPSVAFEFGAKSDPLSMYKQDVCTIPINMAGLPALSMPFGLVNNMPVGLQLVGKTFAEGTLLRIAYTLEQNTEMTKIRPDLMGVK